VDYYFIHRQHLFFTCRSRFAATIHSTVTWKVVQVEVVLEQRVIGHYYVEDERFVVLNVNNLTGVSL
jgi:hypothetical protein